MDIEGWTFEDWQARFPLGWSEDAKLQEDVISPDSWFLEISQTSPLPRSSSWADWHWSSDPKVVLEFVRNIVLPYFISIWFFHRDDEPLPCQQGLDLAREVGSYPDDIPLVQAVVDLVERINANEDRGSILTALQEAADLYNARFASTSTWNLSWEIYGDVRSAAQTIWDSKLCVRPPQLEERELGEHEWIEMCLRSHQDPAANEFVCSAINDDSYL